MSHLLNNKMVNLSKGAILLIGFISFFPFSYVNAVEGPWTFGTTGNSRWTVPDGVTKIGVFVLGGGGGGSVGRGMSTTYSDDFSVVGASGGFGGMTYAEISVVPGQQYYMQTGSGGLAAPNYTGVAQNGGISWFSSDPAGDVPSANAFVSALGGGGSTNTLSSVNVVDGRINKTIKPVSDIGGLKTISSKRGGYFPLGGAKLYWVSPKEIENPELWNVSVVSHGSSITTAQISGGNFHGRPGGASITDIPYNTVGPYVGASISISAGGGFSGDQIFRWDYSPYKLVYVSNCFSLGNCSGIQTLTPYYVSMPDPFSYWSQGGAGSVNDGNARVGFRGLISIKDITPTTPAPSTPTGLTATPSTTCGSGVINISWTASAGATSYTLKDNGVVISPGPVGAVTSFSHTGLTAGSGHIYTISVTTASGSSGYSSPTASVTAPAACTTAPPTPTATARSCGGIDISWTASAGATSYTLKDNGVVISPGPVGAVTSFSHTGLTAGSGHIYTISVTTASGSSGYSSPTASVTAPAACTTAPPTYLTATPNTLCGTGEITLSWPSMAGATGYYLSSASSTGTKTYYITQGNITPGTVMDYPDTGLSPNGYYLYGLSAIYSAGVSATTTSDYVSAPAKCVSPPTVITSGASSVNIYDMTLNGAITATGGAIATQHGFAYGIAANLSTGVVATTTLGVQTGTGAFTSDVINLEAGTRYYFRAYAKNSAGTGYGDILWTTTLAVASPTLTATCSVLPPTISTGGQAIWTAVPSGGNGSYTYSWTGSNGLNGITNPLPWTYNSPTSPGNLNTASVSVTSNGITIGPLLCSNSLDVNPTGVSTCPATLPANSFRCVDSPGTNEGTTQHMYNLCPSSNIYSCQYQCKTGYYVKNNICVKSTIYQP